MGGWRKGHPGFGHAIGAAEVAAFGDADTKIVMLAGVVVCKEGGEGFGVSEALFSGEGVRL